MNTGSNFDMDYNRNRNENQKVWRVSELIEVTLPIRASILPFDDFDFIIYDTPGSNSASNIDHTEVLKKAMEGQTNGLPIFVTTPDNMDGTDNNELIKTIKKLGGALDESNLIIVVNKSERSSKTLAEKKDKKLAVSKLNPAGIYFVSSIVGLGFKKIISGNSEETEVETMGMTISVTLPKWIDNDYSLIFQSNCSNFKKKKEPLELYRYNIISRHQFDTYINLETDEKNLGYHNSGLHAIEYAIREFAMRTCTNRLKTF